MKAGKAFELLVKRILLHIGFSEVKSDEWYILSNGTGQMIRGLGEVHDADVLLEPPVQTPFYTPTRLLVECKDYEKPIGLPILRGALGLREDINHFELVDVDEIQKRYSRRCVLTANPRVGVSAQEQEQEPVHRNAARHSSQRYLYQVAVASMSGFTKPAQKFAAVHRISLIEFDKMPFWEDFCKIIERKQGRWCTLNNESNEPSDTLDDDRVIEVIDSIAKRSAVAITDSGQMLFLYKAKEDNRADYKWNDTPRFEGSDYILTWQDKNKPWKLRIGNEIFRFQLPSETLKQWLESSSDERDLKINAVHCKLNAFSNMVVYYCERDRESGTKTPTIKMIKIMRGELKEVLRKLENTE